MAAAVRDFMTARVVSVRFDDPIATMVERLSFQGIQSQANRALDHGRPENVRLQRRKHLGVDRVHPADQAVAADDGPAFPMRRASVEQHTLFPVRPATYQCDGRGTSWLKIKNPEYSQAEGRHDLFEARREPIRRSREQRGKLALSLR